MRAEAIHVAGMLISNLSFDANMVFLVLLESNISYYTDPLATAVAIPTSAQISNFIAASKRNMCGSAGEVSLI